MARNTTANTASNARPYQFTTSDENATLTGVTIATGASTISATGSYPYTLSTGSYTNAYTDYEFNGGHHYIPARTTTTVTPEGTWSVSGSGASYVSVNASTGTITVNSLPTDGIKTITLSCTPSYSGTDGDEVTKEITLMPVLPTAITASESSLALCIGSEATATYSFTPAAAYNNVVASSSNTSVATVSKVGNTITVNAVALGSATITLNARNTSNATVCSTTISVTVQNPAATPVVSFNSSTSQITITSATDGATIYYTTDGSTPSVHSTVYNGPLTLNSAATIKAIAAKDGYCNSEVGTGEACILQRPYINTNNGTGVTFESDDAGVTFYYTYSTSFDPYGNPNAPADPTTSSTAWHTGDARIPTGTGSGNIRANAIVKVIAVKDGCVSSPVVGRWNTSEDYSIGNWVFAYRDEGGEYHFLENVPGVNNGVSSLTNTNIFKPDVTIWEGLRYGDPNANYETGIVLKNNNEYFYLYNESLTDGNPTNPITRNDFINEMLMPEGTINGVKMRWLYFIDSWDAAMTQGVFAELGFDKDDEEWAIPDVHISEAGLYQNLTTGTGGHYYCPVVFPAFIHEGHNYDLNVDYPVNYETVKESLNKGQSKAITAFTSEVGDATSTPGVYCPEYYEVGETNTLWHKYWFANTVTPMDAAPTGTTDIRITYQLLNGTQYCELVGNTLTLVSDPGRDLLVTVRITATPYIDGVAVPEAAQTKDYQINLLTAPPFPAPVISRVEGTNDYQMECSALGSIIEYRIDGSANCAAYGDVENTPTHPGWCLYDGPITVTTAGTVITARSYRLSPDAGMSDPVDYLVGGAMLLPPVITIDDDGNVTLAANPANSSLVGYTSESFYYTVNGSDPDPSNVGPVTSYYGGSFTVTNGQIVKAVAKADGFANSAIASETYKIASGTSSYGVVTLNDYEDHNWSYYQASADLPDGYPDALHSPYPRNVQITYYGYGNKTLSTADAAAPAANTFTGNTTAADVKVGIADEGHTFLYYKTLECDANGRYPYELIPNPFYVRPAVTDYDGSRTLRLVMNDAGGDGWGGSQLIVDFSDNTTTRTFQLASGSTQATTFTVSSGVTVTLTWVTGGGKNDECSFVLSYDGGDEIYSSGANPRNGKLKVFKVAGTYTVGSYTGFYKWRVKSVTDGSIYAASSGGNAIATTSTTSDDNVMLDAETTYYFVPSDAGTTNANNATSMQVELEAMWALAAINDGTTTTNTNYGSVERNFYIKRSGTSNSILGVTNRPITYSSFYPNGTTDGTTPATESDILSIHNNGAMSLSVDTKIEYYKINGDNTTITCNNHNLIIGRGVSPYNTYVAYLLQGINANATDLNYSIRVESGIYRELSFIKSSTQTVSGRYYVKSILGSDYDRATNTNSNLSVSAGAQLFFSQQVSFSGSSNRDAKTFDLVVKSGEYQRNYWSNQNESGGGGYQHSFYCGPNQGTNNYPGIRYVIIEGGEMGCLNGGRGTNGAKGTYAPSSDENPTFTARIKGGHIHGAVFGGAADSDSPGSRRIIVTGGTIEGWIAAGANGTGSSGGTNSARSDGNSYIYVGGDALVGGTNVKTVNQTVGGQVFGAGRGQNGQEASINNSNVVVADDAEISGENGGNVYGGGYTGYVKQVSNVYVLGGTVEGKVFGGAYGNGNAMQTVNVTMTGGLVTDGVYGGSNSTGTVGDVTMHIDGGQVGEDAENIGYVHGGGLGNATRVTGSVNMTIGSAVDAEDYVTIFGDVYGGSAQGKTNGNNSRTAGAVTNVTMNAGKIHGSLYGGGLGNNTYAADVYGPVQVTVNGGGVHATHQDGSGAVYGCNNVNGAPQSTVAVDIYGTDDPADGREYALDAVYGGGNKASYTSTPTVEIHNCGNSIEYVYGGGNAANVAGTDVTIYGGDSIGYVFGGGNGTVSAANVTGNVDLKIYGGTIRHVFGGNNTSGTIGGSISVNVDKQTEAGHASCPMRIGEVFSGGNMADSKAGALTIGCTGDYVEATGSDRYGYELEGIGDVYGGANKANVTGDIELTINGGIINRAFGGNNFSGNISGKINVIVNKTESCGWYLGYVYGGGNQAAYTAPAVNYPNVSVLNGKVTYDVYGGGYGDVVDDSQGKITGSTYVEIKNNGIVGRNVFGGGNAAAVTGDTDVRVLGGARIFGNVYGGGNQGEIGGNTKVIVNGN